MLGSHLQGLASQLTLGANTSDAVGLEAVLGPCPVTHGQKEVSKGHVGHEAGHYTCTAMEDGTSVAWEQLLAQSRAQQYEDMCKAQPLDMQCIRVGCCTIDIGLLYM